MSMERHRNNLDGAVDGTVLQAQTVTADTIVMHAPDSNYAALRTPRQLPLATTNWVDREDEFAKLRRFMSAPGATRIALTGLGGVGKTALAVQWLHDCRDSHPDGALYADLGGWSSGGPTTPQAVLAAWLRALGVPVDDLPVDLNELAALYRTVTADRALVVLADNAISVAQVRPLLPASATSIIAVTSRKRLAGLRIAGFDYLDLECLLAPIGASLLAKLSGVDGTTPEQRRVFELLSQRCHGHPLALSIAGAHLATRPSRTADQLITLLPHHHPLAISMDDASVRGVFDVSYDELEPTAARLYRLLAEHPGAEFTSEPAAAGLKGTLAITEHALAQLVDANLLTEIRDHRYRHHDLLREHATELADRHDTKSARHAAKRRMIEWYLRRTAAADLAINSFPRRFSPVYEDLNGATFINPRQALDWFADERANILASQQLAAEHDWDGLVYQFAEALWNPLRPNYASDELAETQQLGADAARRCKHVLESVCLTRLGFAESNRGNTEAAVAACTAAYECATDHGSQWAQSAALSTRARAFTAADDPRRALTDLAEALEIDEEQGERRSVALRHRRIGEAYTHPKITDYPQAIWHLRKATEIMSSLADEIGHARVVTYLARAHLGAGQCDAALFELRRVLRPLQSSGASAYLADVYTLMGRAHAELGHLDDADVCFADAIAQYAAIGPGTAKAADEVRQRRDQLAHRTADEKI